MSLTPPQKASLEADFQTALAAERILQNAHIPTNPRFLQRLLSNAVTHGAVSSWTDEYDGPRGKGWLLHAQATVSGTVYFRREDSANEPERTHDWEELT